MKKFLLGLLLATSALAEGPLLDTTNSNPRLQWDWPTNYWNGVAQQLVNVTNAVQRATMTNVWNFCYYTTNIPTTSMTSWTLFYITNNPVRITTSDGRWVHEVPIPQPLLPSCYFAVGTSNYLGLTFFGGLAATPPLLPNSQQNFHLQ